MNPIKIAGRAALFATLDLAGDVFLPHAFTACLRHKKPSDIKMLFMHDCKTPIGRWTKIYRRIGGLYVEGELFTDCDTAPRNLEKARAAIEANAIDGLSVGFRALTHRREPKRRVISRADLIEISVVTFPMQPRARFTRIDF